MYSTQENISIYLRQKCPISTPSTPPSAPLSARAILPSVEHSDPEAWAPSAKWKLATGRSTQLHGAIAFDYVGYSKQGVPMRELCTRSTTALASMITRANEQVLAHTSISRIALRILWPGYEQLESTRTIEISAQGPITRAQLGAIVSQNFARFLERARSEQATPADWYFSPNGIRFKHLILLSLKNVFENTWQADVAIDFC
ncbi:hypothetical protein H0H81_007810 [Sphagnurus paluster]|uniref:Uncharacterized protein n=1 Tax=Sphagnurus paluster TaxID=117069 RepID=A0A9P7FSJ1_9AGAR|nr:hypothetical protein H0H81_007810 [Sphagnurus paluster]